VSVILPSTSAERLAQLMLMLSSSHDGEVVNAAARAIGRLLDAERVDWHMLASGVCRTRPGRTNDDNHYSGMHWRSAAEFCARFPERLNSWEQDFIDGMLKWRRTPTQKQLDVLENIRQRILAETQPQPA
jgi:hypothetical protein